MVLSGEAVKIAQEKNPNMRIISGLDCGDFYAFRLMDRSVKPKSILGIPIAPTIYSVKKKDGAMGTVHVHEIDWAKAKDLNVMLFLSEEDRKFAKAIERMETSY